jgi:PAS domain S-box-containing protein
MLALPSLALIVHSGLIERRAAIEEARKECLEIVNHVASEQQAVVEGVQQLVTALALLPEVQSRDVPATEALLVRLLKQNPQYATIGIADARGVSWVSAIPVEGPLSMAGRRYYENAVRRGCFSSGEYAVGRALKRPVIHFGYPVKNASGKLISVIVVALNLPRAPQVLDKKDVPSGASFGLLDHRGIILARSLRDAASERLIGHSDLSRDMFAKMTGSPVEGTFAAKGNDGRPRIVAYKKISLPHEETPYLYIRFSVPFASVLSNANAAMLKDLAALLLVYLAGLALVWFVGERVIVRPVLKLVSASRRLAGGVARVNVSGEVKGGDLGALACAFDDMAESLVQKEAARDAAETSLRESEERYRTTVASIGDAVIVTDKEGIVTFLNTEAERLIGWTAEEAIGRPLPEVFRIINAKTRLPVENPVDKVLRAGRVVGLATNHTLLVARNGSEIPIDDSGAPVRRADGTIYGVVLVFRDSTERSQAEEHMAHLASFPQLNPNPILEVAYSGEITFHNPATEGILEGLGIDKGEIGVLLPKDLAALLGTPKSGERSAVYREIAVKDRIFGAYIDFPPGLSAIRIYAQDITERKLREARIARLTRLYAMLSQVNEAIVRIRDQEALYGEACRIIADEGGFPLVWIGKIDGRQVAPVVACGPAVDYLKEIRIETDGELGRGPTGTCVREGRLVVNDDFDTNVATAPWREAALRYGFRASAAFPLRCGAELVGVLTLYASQPGDFDEEQVRLLDALAADVSYALDTMEQERRRARAEVDLQNSLRRFELLAHTAGKLLQDSDPQKHIDSLCRKVMEHLGCQAFFNFLTVEGTGKLKLNAYAGIPEEEALKIEWVDFAAVFSDAAACGDCPAAAGHIPDAQARIADRARSYNIRAYASHPLLGPDGLVIGSLSFGACARDAFTDEELSLMKAVADQVAVAIIRMRDEKAMKKARDELEERVRERTEDIRQQAELLELAHNAVIVRDREDRITFWNTSAKDLYGWTKAEALGSPSQVLLDTQFGVPFDQYMTGLFREGRWEGDLVHRTKDGRRITVLSRQALQRDPDGNPMAILEINLDVTDARRTEQQLRQAQKMEALGTLTGGIAHDFNNILAAIIGFSEMAKGQAPEGSRQEHDIRRVLDAALRGRDLVRQMLTFSRDSGREKEPVQLSRIVEEVMKLLRASIPSTISMTVEVESESGLVLADPTQMQQVVMNLCMNAAYAMREKGGILYVTLSDFSVRAGGKDDDMRPGLYMKLVVRDTGVGMPPEIIDKIFDPFFTTKERGEGTGLGLSVVLGIVRQHEGYITMESEMGEGTAFTVYLPKASGRRDEETAGDESMPTGHERVLFVDDEEPLIEMGRELLEDLGYEVTVKNDSVEALALFTADPSRFDILITDQTMPDITGMELAKAVFTVRPGMPVILCTGYSHLVDADSAKAAGIKGFVMKPLTKKEIALAVRKALDEPA